MSEILGTVDDGRIEVCATADAVYDSVAGQVAVTLDAFERHVVAAGDGHHVAEPWMPPREQVTEHLAREDATTFAKDVFRSWTRRVRTSVPSELHLRS